MGIEHEGQATFNDAVGKVLDDVQGKLFHDATLTDSVTVTTSGVKVPHKFGQTPRGWFVVSPQAGADVWQSQAPDGRYLYLSSSATVTCRLVVF